VNRSTYIDFGAVQMLTPGHLGVIERQGDLPDLLMGIAPEMLGVIDARIARRSAVGVGEILFE